MQRYDITGMSCAACAGHVEKAVAAVPGVASVTVSLLTNSMQVDYTPVRYVKKPAGAKPGFVVYDRYFTAVVRAALPDGVREQKK